MGVTKRVKCNICDRDTPATQIGGTDYCSVCGNRYSAMGRTVTPRRSMDLSPRRRPVVSTKANPKPAAQVAPAHSAQVLEDVSHTPTRAKDSAKPATPKPATALHARTQAAHKTGILDLRTEGHHNERHLNHIAEEIPHDTIAHANNHTPAPPPKSAVHERHIAQFTDRFNRAKQVERSQHISKFGAPSLNELIHPEPTPTPATTAIATQYHHAAAAPLQASTLMPHAAIAQHKALASLTPHPPAPTPPASRPTTSAGWRPHLSLSPHTNRVAATAAVVAIMGGYIWFQNSPKLALQSAGNKAGLTVTLPGYLPSSYSLASTNTSPGVVTLSFASPSASEPLKIVQHSTTWDSNSLLDNFVAKTADDYSSIPGQGLTIYLYNNNQATWVNHGIWYSIEGASRLSREQILKIAYSL